MQKRAIETRRKILTSSIRLFLEQGYKETTVSQIIEDAGVARGSYLNLFPTKETILLELTKAMFSGQFSMAQEVVGEELPPIYIYAVETSIQLTLTEFHENLRELYVAAYSLPETSEYLYQKTTGEIKRIFQSYFPDYAESDFYEMEIGTAGLMRNYMAKACGIHFPFRAKLDRFLTAALRVYKVSEEDREKIITYINGLDIKAIADDVMWKLFAMLEMKFEFKLSRDGE